MRYRDEGEPEYIDDDEYYDADDYGGERRSSNVLGGSGSIGGRDAAYQAPEDGPAWEQEERPPSSRGSRRSRKDRPAAAPGGTKGRNPAPASASSEERRARLAGKHKAAQSQKPTKTETVRPAANDSKKRGRFSSLRGRLSRGDKAGEAKTRSGQGKKPSRFSAIASRIGSWRRRQDDKGRTADKAGERGNFAASYGRQRDNIGQNAPYSARQERAKATGRQIAQPSMTPKIEASDWLDLDRKLDLIGVALVFGAIVLLVSALSQEQATIGAVHALIGQLFGWGAFAVPVSMFAVGMWLIVRHFGDQAPTIDPLRLAGMALAFVGMLALFQFVESLTYAEPMSRLAPCRDANSFACMRDLVQQSYLASRGGGYIGGQLYSALVYNLTEIGGLLIVFMVLTFAAMMITRASMAELAVVAIGTGRSLRSQVAQYLARRRAALLQAQEQMALPQQGAQLRVSKPQAAQLSSPASETRALPEPNSMPIPIPARLRSLLSRRAKPESELEAEPVALPAEPTVREEAQSPGRLERFFARSKKRDSSTAPDENAVPKSTQSPRSNVLERFLNLGDDLPSQARAESVPERTAPPARPARARPPQTAAERPETPAIVSPAPPRRRVQRPIEDIQPSLGDKIVEPPMPASEPPTPPPVQPLPDALEPLEDLEAAPLAEEEARSLQDEGLAELEPASADPPLAEEAPVPEQPAAANASGARQGAIEWKLPDYRELLNSGSASNLDREPLLQQAQIIVDTLASFGAPGRVVEINTGPVITQYGVEPAYLTGRTGKRNRVKVSAIAKLDKDLQLALGARSIRVEAPVPGKGYVGIEVPNPRAALVSLRDVMESESYRKIDSPLAIALGMSVDGAPISADLTAMPHLLIAGTTGSGKSVCINTIINSIIINNSPETVKFIMVDPKRVELTGYNGLPHLVAPVVVEFERIIGVLRWVTTEMDERYKKFSQAGARNIIDYNNNLEPELASMPYIVVIIDELADLMMMAPDDTERAITRIAALARATGIHLVIATQRPSVDVVTGLIKANCPARIAFAVAGSVDSRVILDQPGAERLLGKGDMLYLSGDSPAPLRMQGVHVSNEEIKRISRFWKLQSAGVGRIEMIRLPVESDGESDSGARPQRQRGSQTAFWDMSPQPDMTGMAMEGKTGNLDPQEDELYQTAVDMVRRLEKASISLLQRRLRIGYTRAARLMDMMEERGVVGPPKEGSSKPRDVLPES